MAVEIGEVREKWGQDVWQMAIDYAEKMKDEERPFYIVFCAKPDRTASHKFRQTIKAYYAKPPRMLGILVWYVDHKTSTFEFKPDLSAPPDIPLDPKLLSTKASDASTRLMEQASKVNVLLS